MKRIHYLLSSKRTKDEAEKERAKMMADPRMQAKDIRTRITFSKNGYGFYIPDLKEGEGCYNVWGLMPSERLNE
jgi:hypothetical protein